MHSGDEQQGDREVCAPRSISDEVSLHWLKGQIVPPPTLRDVAKPAGVSAATVSRVANGRDNVSGERRTRVLIAILGLQYRPNIRAAQLGRANGGMKKCGKDAADSLFTNQRVICRPNIRWLNLEPASATIAVVSRHVFTNKAVYHSPKQETE
jgi:hypothetical protein